MLLVSSLFVPASLLISGGLVLSGDGTAGVIADVRLIAGRVAEVGKLTRLPGEEMVIAKGLVVCPGFIDAHSHADSNLGKDPSAASQLLQGVTTAVIGQDGGGRVPLADTFGRIRALRPPLNFASFVGHGALRRKVMGDNQDRAPTSAEIRTMKALLEEEMNMGALGLSSGLEYEPGKYSSTEELIELAKAAAKYGGVYISHVRDEGNGALDSIREIIRIAEEAKIAVQISHIKLATASVWGKAAEACKLIESARKRGVRITADIYPYRYWQSTIRVLTLETDYDNPDVWRRALVDVGGAQNVLLSHYTAEPSWVGKTLQQIAADTKRDVTEIIREIVRKTYGADAKDSESIVCTSMTEADIETFMKQPWTMFCSDGSIGGTHPRGAGAFPRVLAHYVRERRLLPLPEAIRKMTSFPAKMLSIPERGRIRPGYIADIVIFDPETIQDHATPPEPTRLASGVRDVFVGGVAVVRDGRLTGARPGQILGRASR